MPEPFSTPVHRVCKAWTVTLYIGGAAEIAKDELTRLAALEGACWSVEPTEFIYSGGREQGVIVRRIAYARFPVSVRQAQDEMLLIGYALMERLGQGSFSIVGSDESVFVTRRKEG
jgi:hypothetical protein